MKKIKDIIETCNSYAEIYFVDLLVAEKYKNIIADILNSKSNDLEECVRLFDKQKEYMQQMYLAADEIGMLFVELVKSVEGDK